MVNNLIIIKGGLRINQAILLALLLLLLRAPMGSGMLRTQSEGVAAVADPIDNLHQFTHHAWNLGSLRIECIQDPAVRDEVEAQGQNGEQLNFVNLAHTSQVQLRVCQADVEDEIEKQLSHRAVKFNDQARGCLSPNGGKTDTAQVVFDESPPPGLGCGIFRAHDGTYPLLSALATIRKAVYDDMETRIREKLYDLASGACAEESGSFSNDAPCMAFATGDDTGDPGSRVDKAIADGHSRIVKIANIYLQMLSACYEHEHPSNNDRAGASSSDSETSGVVECRSSLKDFFGFNSMEQAPKDKLNLAQMVPKIPGKELSPELRVKNAVEFIAIHRTLDFIKRVEDQPETRTTFADVVGAPSSIPRLALHCLPLMHGQTGFNVMPGLLYDDSRQECKKQIGNALQIQPACARLAVGQLLHWNRIDAHSPYSLLSGEKGPAVDAMQKHSPTLGWKPKDIMKWIWNGFTNLRPSSTLDEICLKASSSKSTDMLELNCWAFAECVRKVAELMCRPT